MNAIIIDDEPKAIELLKSYIQHFRNISLTGTFRNGIRALEFLAENDVELIFLDINMPYLSGISLSKIINRKTKIIFTTAYSEYAVESYEVNAVDYLLKPISLERFTKAVEKVIKTKDPDENTSNNISIKSGKKLHIADPKDVMYLSKEGNYIVYHLLNQKIMARQSITEALNVLPDYFIQTHKSYIINMMKVEFVDKDDVSIMGNLIPIGASFKVLLLKRLNRILNK